MPWAVFTRVRWRYEFVCVCLASRPHNPLSANLFKSHPILDSAGPCLCPCGQWNNMRTTKYSARNSTREDPFFCLCLWRRPIINEIILSPIPGHILARRRCFTFCWWWWLWGPSSRARLIAIECVQVACAAEQFMTMMPMGGGGGQLTRPADDDDDDHVERTRANQCEGLHVVCPFSGGRIGISINIGGIVVVVVVVSTEPGSCLPSAVTKQRTG